MSCGVGGRCGLDPTLLWLWQRPVAIALIRPLAWEPPHATGAALEKAKRQTNKQTKMKKQNKKNQPNKKNLECHHKVGESVPIMVPQIHPLSLRDLT